MSARSALVLLGLLAACGAELERGAASDEAQASPELGRTPTWLPGPASTRTRSDPSRAELDHECRSCHAEVAHEWAQSQHASAWSSAAFQRAFASEPRPFCQGCHAPETSPREPVPAWAAELGVGCVTCHVDPSGEIWAGLDDAEKDLDAPHPVARAAAFESPQGCAACHEFEFPDAALRDQPLAMQSTLSEHQSSRERERSCIDCHMPTDAGWRSHVFPGAYDLAMLRRALTIRVERPSPEVVRIELGLGEVGHAVPTGDLLRRLELALVEVDGEGHERVHARAWLGRRFEDRMQSNHIELREQVADDRVGVGETTRVVELRVPSSVQGELRWRVVHQRVATHARRPGSARIEGAIEIASAPLP